VIYLVGFEIAILVFSHFLAPRLNLGFNDCYSRGCISETGGAGDRGTPKSQSFQSNQKTLKTL
jgi:hypothetical protein